MCGLEAHSGYDPVLGEQRSEQCAALDVPLLDGGAEGREDHLDFDRRARSYCDNWVSGECLAHDDFSIDTRNVGLRPGKNDTQHRDWLLSRASERADHHAPGIRAALESARWRE